MRGEVFKLSSRDPGGSSEELQGLLMGGELDRQSSKPPTHPPPRIAAALSLGFHNSHFHKDSVTKKNGI